MMPNVTVESLRRFVEKRGAVTGVVASAVAVVTGRKIEPDRARPRYLLTEPGAGYRLVNPNDRI